LLIALIVFSVPGSATEQNAKTSDVIHSTLPPAEVWNLLEEGRLKIVTRVEDLPENVKVGLAKLFHQQQLEMSDTEHRGKVPKNTGPHCADCIGRTLLFAGLSPKDRIVWIASRRKRSIISEAVQLDFKELCVSSEADECEQGLAHSY
jgi:hypothetical protein